MATSIHELTYQVWRVVPRNEEHLHFLVDLERRTEGVYDFWKEPVGVGYSVDIMIPMRHLSVAKHDLLAGGLSYDVMIDDVGQLDWKVNAENVKAKAGKVFDLYSYNSHRVGAGGSDDWAKGVAGVKYSYTIELRDKGRYGFIAPPSEIKPCGEETFEAFKVVARDTMNGIL
ncbi:PREDICTED: carboxypeptidase A2-like [Priapulus caudatus]|uniref:Carboxypeptidase A2-like n=1 Tax=Priapulus caudatus TaxID=37621 RepID=A0ABM1E7J8_PRICU|nr:PREDICTED: carboxypeptidase A2-like [Priapulus caudatus]